MKMRYYYFITAFVFASFVFPQSTVEGIVSDESGNPLVGANVTIDGTSFGVASGTGGNYIMRIPAGGSAGWRGGQTSENFYADEKKHIGQGIIFSLKRTNFIEWLNNPEIDPIHKDKKGKKIEMFKTFRWGGILTHILKKNGKEYDQYPPNLKPNVAIKKFKKDFRNTKIV